MIDDLQAFVANIFVFLVTRAALVQDKKLQFCLVWFGRGQELHWTTLDQIGWFEASLPFAQCSYTCTENAPHKIEKDTQACTIVLMMIAIIV